MKKKYGSHIASGESGFTIIEVLIAIAIFSIGFMAVGALQTTALMSVGTATDRTIAMELLDAHTEELKRIPMYTKDIWDFGTGATPVFERAPEFTEAEDPFFEDYGDYTVYWWADNQHTIANRWTGGNLVISENVTVTVTPKDGDPVDDAIQRIEFVKYWVTDN
jgi:prepilin-type N-terminal cleavage/methylation domain-containing protein